MNVKDSQGRIPIFEAVFDGKIDIFNLLKNRGANMTVVNKYGDTLVHAAAMSNTPGLVNALNPTKEAVNKPNI